MWRLQGCQTKTIHPTLQLQALPGKACEASLRLRAHLVFWDNSKSQWVLRGYWRTAAQANLDAVCGLQDLGADRAVGGKELRSELLLAASSTKLCGETQGEVGAHASALRCWVSLDPNCHQARNERQSLATPSVRKGPCGASYQTRGKWRPHNACSAGWKGSAPHRSPNGHVLWWNGTLPSSAPDEVSAQPPASRLDGLRGPSHNRESRQECLQGWGADPWPWIYPGLSFVQLCEKKSRKLFLGVRIEIELLFVSMEFEGYFGFFL